MSVRINGEEYDGILGILLAIPIIIFVFASIGIVFLVTATVLLSPVILLVWMLAK